ncbi:MAG: hypothetical protein WCP01_03770 [Methylococcaceae bacterium]
MHDKHTLEADSITAGVETLPPRKQRYRLKLDSLSDVKGEMTKVYKESRSGIIEIVDASKLVWMLSAVGKIIEVSDLEKRVEALESKR